jgi:hypothetical protein
MRFGHFGGNILRKVGDIGGRVVNAVSNVKNVMDKTGITGILTGALASNPVTAPVAAGLAMANPILGGAKAAFGAMSRA